jgi:hypothetical protein
VAPGRSRSGDLPLQLPQLSAHGLQDNSCLTAAGRTEKCETSAGNEAVQPNPPGSARAS